MTQVVTPDSPEAGDPLADKAARFAAQLNSLATWGESFPIGTRYPFADLQVHALVLDVLEHARVCQLIVRHRRDAARAGFANARAAFEAATSLALLVSGPSFLEMAARFRAYELQQLARRDEARAAFEGATGSPRAEVLTLAQAEELEAARWDECRAGSGAVLRAAVTSLTTERPSNWARMSERSRFEKVLGVVQRHSSIEGGASLLGVLWRELNAQHHVGSRDLERVLAADANGDWKVGPHPEDPGVLLETFTVAAVVAECALKEWLAHPDRQEAEAG